MVVMPLAVAVLGMNWIGWIKLKDKCVIQLAATFVVFGLFPIPFLPLYGIGKVRKKLINSVWEKDLVKTTVFEVMVSDGFKACGEVWFVPFALAVYSFNKAWYKRYTNVHPPSGLKYWDFAFLGATRIWFSPFALLGVATRPVSKRIAIVFKWIWRDEILHAVEKISYWEWVLDGLVFPLEILLLPLALASRLWQDYPNVFWLHVQRIVTKIWFLPFAGLGRISNGGAGFAQKRAWLGGKVLKERDVLNTRYEYWNLVLQGFLFFSRALLFPFFLVGVSYGVLVENDPAQTYWIHAARGPFAPFALCGLHAHWLCTWLFHRAATPQGASDFEARRVTTPLQPLPVGETALSYDGDDAIRLDMPASPRQSTPEPHAETIYHPESFLANLWFCISRPAFLPFAWLGLISDKAATQYCRFRNLLVIEESAFDHEHFFWNTVMSGILLIFRMLVSPFFLVGATYGLLGEDDAARTYWMHALRGPFSLIALMSVGFNNSLGQWGFLQPESVDLSDSSAGHLQAKLLRSALPVVPLTQKILPPSSFSDHLFRAVTRIFFTPIAFSGVLSNQVGQRFRELFNLKLEEDVLFPSHYYWNCTIQGMVVPLRAICAPFALFGLLFFVFERSNEPITYWSLTLRGPFSVFALLGLLSNVAAERFVYVLDLEPSKFVFSPSEFWCNAFQGLTLPARLLAIPFMWASWMYERLRYASAKKSTEPESRLKFTFWKHTIMGPPRMLQLVIAFPCAFLFMLITARYKLGDYISKLVLCGGEGINANNSANSIPTEVASSAYNDGFWSRSFLGFLYVIFVFPFETIQVPFALLGAAKDPFCRLFRVAPTLFGYRNKQPSLWTFTLRGIWFMLWLPFFLLGVFASWVYFHHLGEERTFNNCVNTFRNNAYGGIDLIFRTLLFPVYLVDYCVRDKMVIYSPTAYSSTDEYFHRTAYGFIEFFALPGILAFYCVERLLRGVDANRGIETAEVDAGGSNVTDILTVANAGVMRMWNFGMSIIHSVGNGFNWLGGVIYVAVVPVGSAVYEAAKRVGNAVLGIMSSIASAIGKAVESVLGFVSNAVGKVFS